MAEAKPSSLQNPPTNLANLVKSIPRQVANGPSHIANSPNSRRPGSPAKSLAAILPKLKQQEEEPKKDGSPKPDDKKPEPKPKTEDTKPAEEDEEVDHQGVRRLLLLKKDFVIDPEGNAIYYWSAFVACAGLYNFWAIIIRIAFTEMRTLAIPRMFFSCMDVITDLVFLVDLLINFRMGYLEDGILVKDPIKLADHYMLQRKGPFIRDIFSALPFSSIALLFTGMLARLTFCFAIARDGLYYPMLRIPKLMKYHTMFNFINAWDLKTNSPNMHRATKLLIYLWTSIHWIACFYYLISEWEGLGSNDWVLEEVAITDELQGFGRKYLRSMYWSTMTLTTIGDAASPVSNLEIVFTGFTFLIGVFLFATVVGNVGDVISNMNAARMEFQGKMDGIKFYMTHHTIPDELQTRVKKWAEYSWNRTQAMDDHHMLDILPFRLRAEIAKHIHLETLQKVKIFEDCEKGLLCELVVRLRSQIYSPSDYICRKGEIGREMYIINHGKVEVLVQVGEQEPTVVATLTEGNYFGEISLLKLEDGCNRRNADVRSVGYSELLVLSKRDLHNALSEYPEARKALEKQAKDRMSQSKEAERMARTKAEQNLRVMPIGLGAGVAEEDDDKGDGKDAHKADQLAKMKEREMGELRHVLRELRAFDSQALRSKLGFLEERCSMLEKELGKKNEELHAAMSRVSRLELSSGHSRSGKTKDNGINKDIWHSTPTKNSSDLSSGDRTPPRTNGLTNGRAESPVNMPYTAVPALAQRKQGRVMMSSLFQGFSWENEEKFIREEDEEEEELPKYTVRILPIVVPGIAINDELVQEPRKIHMAVNVRLEPEKKIRVPKPADSTGLKKTSSLNSIDGIDDDETISGISDVTKESSTVDGDSSLEDSSDDEGSGSGSGSDSDLD